MPFNEVQTLISGAHGALIGAACVACIAGLATSVAVLCGRLALLATGFASPFDPSPDD